MIRVRYITYISNVLLEVTRRDRLNSASQNEGTTSSRAPKGFRKKRHASTLKRFDRTQQQIASQLSAGAMKAAKNPRGLAAVADGTPA